eukprot:358206-Chlamydomonas_euryale.AAC.2
MRAILAVTSARLQRSAGCIAPYVELKRSAATEVICMESSRMAALLREGKPKSSSSLAQSRCSAPVATLMITLVGRSAHGTVVFLARHFASRTMSSSPC